MLGFMDVGKIIGQTIATQHSSTFTVLIGFIFGVVTILAEPPVHVLTHQIEEVTNGYVRRPLVLLGFVDWSRFVSVVIRDSNNE